MFIALAGWGWWQWLRGRADDGGRLRVHRMTPRQRAFAAGATFAAWPLLGLLLQHATDSDVPYLDALPTVGSVAGQILLGRKYVENWPVWVAVNAASVALFAWKGLWLTVILYGLFTGMAYCLARRQLPLKVFEVVLADMARSLGPVAQDEGTWRGHRAFLIDGSAFSMPDTPELQRAFGQPGGQAPGCGFPVAKILALFHAHTGLLMRVDAAPLRSRRPTRRRCRRRPLPQDEA